MTSVLHNLLRDAAIRWPKQVAVDAPDSSLCYADLDALSDRMAFLLANRDCSRGDRVAILCEKSIDSYVAIYGILKAGCVYVPMDRRAPASRLAYIAQDCGVKAIVVTDKTKALARKIADDVATIDFLATHSASSESRPTVPLLTYATSDCERNTPTLPDVIDTDVAYILYTSGSTGQPKGVTISHLNSISFVRWASRYSGLRTGERVSGHAPLHFDLSIFDIFASASCGATLIPVPENVAVFPTRMIDWIARSRINVWYSVPSALTMMAQQESFEQSEFPDLRLIIFAGEVFPIKYLKMWVKRFPSLRFDNWYGPTETNVITAYTVNGRESLDKPLPIGSACENVETYLIDENGVRTDDLQAEGELCARGSFVALGYWGDPEKTSESFEFRTFPHERIYRTGDLVRIDKDGHYEYVGRRDHMIKSRGYRIELGEIEAALYAFDSVAAAAVIPVADDTIGSRLIACVSLQSDGKNVSEKEILAFVGKRLPAYMVPERIELFDAIPTTSNGKIDRQLLSDKLC